jgi:hypothetical protein
LKLALACVWFKTIGIINFMAYLISLALSWFVGNFVYFLIFNSSRLFYYWQFVLILALIFEFLKLNNLNNWEVFLKKFKLTNLVKKIILSFSMLILISGLILIRFDYFRSYGKDADLVRQLLNDVNTAKYLFLSNYLSIILTFGILVLV